jgi:hypothetical protein
MRCVNGFRRSYFCMKKVADNLTEAVPTVAHWKQLNMVVSARGLPSASDRLACLLRRQRPLEFVRRDENPQTHGRNIGR